MRVDERAVDGRANKRLLEILGRTLQRPKIKNHHSKKEQNKKQNNPSNSLANAKYNSDIVQV